MSTSGRVEPIKCCASPRVKLWTIGDGLSTVFKGWECVSCKAKWEGRPTDVFKMHAQGGSGADGGLPRERGGLRLSSPSRPSAKRGKTPRSRGNRAARSARRRATPVTVPTGVRLMPDTAPNIRLERITRLLNELVK